MTVIFVHPKPQAESAFGFAIEMAEEPEDKGADGQAREDGD